MASLHPPFNLVLSANFNLSEFIRSDIARKNKINSQYLVSFHTVANLYCLCRFILQPLRNYCGRVDISSGFRCPDLNNSVGGAPSSQHITGHAADIIVKDIPRAVSFLKNQTFDQLIIYKSFIHISYKHSSNRNQIIYHS